MLRVLIAEDEIGIYRLIKDLVEWDAFELELTGYAKDGSEAFAMIQQSIPDIVITDISMPVMNGLSLIEKTRELELPVRFIIVSGYNHFDYAVTALKFGVEDYLLKPLSHDELNNVLEKVVNKIDCQNSGQKKQTPSPSFLRRRAQLRDSFLMQQIFSTSCPVFTSLEKINEAHYYEFRAGIFQMGLCYLDFDEQINVGLQGIILKQIIRIFENYFSERCYDLNTYEKNNYFLYLLNYDSVLAPEIPHVFSYILEEATQFLSVYNQLPITLCMGGGVDDIRKLPDSVKEAYRMLPARLLIGTGRVLDPADFPSSHTPDKHFPVSEQLPLLKNSLEIRDMKAFHQHLQQIFRETAAFCFKAPYLYLQYLEGVVFNILSEMHKLFLFRQDINLLYRQACDLMNQCSSQSQLEIKLTGFLDSLLESSCEEPKGHGHTRLIQTARDYIEAHYNHPLKLEDIADIVFLAPSYFGILFKKETGVTFSSYITTLRVEKAKELLKEIRYNISEISDMIGYQNKRYFSRVFKENVGITPKEYRKMHHNKPY